MNYGSGGELGSAMCGWSDRTENAVLTPLGRGYSAIKKWFAP